MPEPSGVAPSASTSPLRCSPPYQRAFLDQLAARLRGHGTEVHDGTACEIGIFSELLRTGTRRGAIVGLMTDIRTLRGTDDPPHMNLFVRGCIETYSSVHTDTDQALAAVQTLAAQLEGPSAAGGS